MAGEGSEVTRGVLFFADRASFSQFEITQQIGLILAWISAYSSSTLNQNSTATPLISWYSGEIMPDL
jgi:hypothetical protein